MNFACTHFYPEESCEYTSMFPYMHIYIYIWYTRLPQVRSPLYFGCEISSQRDQFFTRNLHRRKIESF